MDEFRTVFTVDEVIDGEAVPHTITHCVYVIRNGYHGILYIGKTKNVVNRLRSHCGVGFLSDLTSIGSYINRHKPESDKWTVELYPASESFVSAMESVLIQVVRPPYNSIYNSEQRELDNAVEQAGDRASAMLDSRYSGL